ncbi:MAG: PilZ domain-containing protein [Rhizobiaceae bacterium]|nr:PilZ domain-containing protein [Rhizobiaceae bacterium]
MPVQSRASSTARMFNERRSAERGSGSASAAVRFPEGGTAECRVRNVSGKGARLTFKIELRLPQKFQLKIGGERNWRDVAVRWRRGNDAGVSFEAPARKGWFR